MRAHERVCYSMFSRVCEWQGCWSTVACTAMLVVWCVWGGYRVYAESRVAIVYVVGKFRDFSIGFTMVLLRLFGI